MTSGNYRVAGVDGCPGGWLCVTLAVESNDFQVAIFHSAAELLAQDPAIQVMAIDMPIGLPNAGSRRCDGEARRILRHRSVCVFNSPIRPALYAPSWLAASAITQALIGQGISKQSWALYPKIINLDISMTPLHQRWCFEIHPEVSFCMWNHQVPMQFAKDSDEGRSERESLIDKEWPGVRERLLEHLKRDETNAQYYSPDDLNDALAALWTAHRIAAGEARRLPERPEIDSRGLRMEMWY